VSERDKHGVLNWKGAVVETQNRWTLLAFCCSSCSVWSRCAKNWLEYKRETQRHRDILSSDSLIPIMTAGSSSVGRQCISCGMTCARMQILTDGHIFDINGTLLCMPVIARFTLATFFCLCSSRKPSSPDCRVRRSAWYTQKIHWHH
jgi:hypothetical protein